MRKNLLIVAKLMILALVLFWIAKSFDRNDWNALVAQEKNWSLLAISFLVVLAANVLSYLRWYVFVHALAVPFTIFEAIRLGFLGNLFNNILLGAVGGDLFRALAAARQAGKKRPEVIASVLVDRALGLLGLVIVAAISLQLFGDSLSTTLVWIRRGAWVCVGVGLVSLALVTFAGHRLPVKLFNKIPAIGHTLYRMTSAGMLFEGRPMLASILVGMSCIVHSLLTIGMYLISIALYSEAPTLPEHFITVPPAFAAAALPLTPGGVGVQEMAVAKLFDELPQVAESYSGLIVAAMYRVELILIAAIGGFYYIFGGKQESQLHGEQ